MIPADEPAIPPGRGAMQTGHIRDYDAAKGFGFIQVEGMEEDIFFPRDALPEAFRGRQQTEMPILNGVHVSFEPPGINPKPSSNPKKKSSMRTETLNLLLTYHAPVDFLGAEL